MMTGPTEQTEHPLSVPEGHPRPALIIVMGVAGSGKSTVGAALAKAISRPFIDGDDLHPKSNVEKMSRGTPLTDADRRPWLALIRSTAERICAQQAQELGEGERPAVVIVCSALKKMYRDILRGVHPAAEEEVPPAHEVREDHPVQNGHVAATASLQTYFIFLDGTRAVLEERMRARKGHFMGAGMLESQLGTLESPVGEEGVRRVDVEGTREEVEGRTREAARELVGV